MKFRRRREDPIDTAINVTSLIDVMFVLLLFFMVSTTFTKQSNLKVDLPRGRWRTDAGRREADRNHHQRQRRVPPQRPATAQCQPRRSEGGADRPGRQ
jgi:biopolymer transport protein ExbD